MLARSSWIWKRYPSCVLRYGVVVTLALLCCSVRIINCRSVLRTFIEGNCELSWGLPTPCAPSTMASGSSWSPTRGANDHRGHDAVGGAGERAGTPRSRSLTSSLAAPWSIPYAHIGGKPMISGDFVPSIDVRGAVKDGALVLAARWRRQASTSGRLRPLHGLFRDAPAWLATPGRTWPQWCAPTEPDRKAVDGLRVLYSRKLLQLRDSRCDVRICQELRTLR